MVSVPVISLPGSPVDARERAPCPPSRQRTRLQLSGSSSVAEKLAVCPEEASPLSPRPGVQTRTPVHRPRACGCHCVAPRLFAFHSGLYLKTRKKKERKEESNRGTALIAGCPCLPSHLKQLCASGMSRPPLRGSRR